MFIVFVKFGPNKTRAGAPMTEHIEWLKRGLSDGVFLATGSLPDKKGGARQLPNTR